MENQWRFNFANPIYLSNVLAAIMGGGIAATVLLKLSQIAEEEVNEAQAYTHQIS